MKWKKCIKKPIVVKFREVERKQRIFVPDGKPDRFIFGTAVKEVWGEHVKTHEGKLFADAELDYIIKGVRGECYPIKKDIFNETYDVI